jgi:DNA mismatch endonuclease, patch repair protein
MADIVDRKTRSRMMASIRGANTEPELVLRRMVYGAGFRYRIHGRGLPGRPDLVLRKYRAVVFVHGCFWHRHAGCRFSTMPASNVPFWSKKFTSNVLRDARNEAELIKAGWRVLVVWECALKPTRARPERTLAQFTRWILSRRRRGAIGSPNG